MQQSFAGKLLDTISFTLLHSLWQGLLLTILIAAMLPATKKSAPALRYSLLTALLFCFIGTVTITFILQWQQGSGITTVFTPAITTLNGFAAQNNYWQILKDFIHHYSSWIMALWAAVVMIKGLRLLLDLYYVNRLRSTGISLPAESWSNHLQQLGHKMGIRKKLRLFESQLVNIPMVAGHFKPVILLPLGMLTQLPVAEVEAVLLHELAHIRRHDYLVNMLQRITGILFFFNPAVLWLSALLRSERENCCDAMAIQHTNDKLTFIEALISVRQHAVPVAPLAMNFLGQKNLLLQRVNRIVHSRNKSLDRAELSFVTISIIAAALYCMNVNTTLPAAAQQPLVAEHTLSAMHAATSMDAKTAIITTAKPGSSGQVAMAPALKERPVTKKITNRTATIATRDILQPIHPAATMEAEKPMLVKNDVDVYHSAAEQDLLQAEKDRYRAALDRQQAERDRAQAALDRKQAEKDRIQAEKDRMQAEKDRMQADKDRAQADLDRIQADKDRAQTMLDAGLAANTHGAIKK